MQNFIVLGIVPGTNIQLNFGDWLLISICLVLLGTLFEQRNNIRAMILGWYVARLIRHHEFGLTASLIQ